jgi:monothiol glutaredoxin
MASFRQALVALACMAVGSAAFSAPASGLSASRMVQRGSFARMSSDFSQLNTDATNDRISELIGSNKIMVFMKGSKMMPQCGFSNAVVQVFNSMKVPFTTFDVLSDGEIRQGIKEFSQWPTIPQVYIDGEFIGGCDIVVEMYQKGELQELAARVSAE